jgi:SAM-dependent methyltransferase
MPTIEELDARFFPGFVSEHARFDALVRRHLRAGHRVLDAGAGHGRAFGQDYRGTAALVVGADLEPEVGGNPNLDAACRADLGRLPFADATFDLVLARYVFEHLPRPGPVLRELRRVLRPSGSVVFHTPNRYHYVALAASLTPTRFHRWFKRKRAGGREPDAHPTFYRANDRRTIARLASANGFRLAELELFEPKPTYLFFHPLAYRAGIAYGRLVSRTERLRDLRANLIGTLRAVEGTPAPGA